MPAKNALLETRSDAERAVSELQSLHIERDGVVNQMEERLAAIRDEYAERLDGLNADIQAEEKLVLAWLKKNEKLFEGPPRSIEFPCGTVGYRLGQERLKTLKGWTWDRVETAVKNYQMAEYLKTVHTLDRDAILRDAKLDSDPIPENTMRQIGLKLHQDDKPYIEIKREDASCAE